MQVSTKVKQLGWMVALWLGGVTSLFIIAYIIRIIMTMAGLKS